MKVEVQSSFSVTVYIAGDLQDARRTLRRLCLPGGLCVTLTPTEFIFAGGVESGVAVGFVQYPRFPEPPERIWERANGVAEALMEDLHQWSALIDGPTETVWLNRKPEGQR